MNLNIKDVLGATIKEILQSPWDTEDGISDCRVFIQTTKDVVFEIPFFDNEQSIFPIKGFNINDVKQLKLINAEIPEGSPICIGSQIEDVYYSKSWPTIGFGLSNGCIIMASDWGPGRFGAFVTPKTKEFLEDVLCFQPK